MSLQGLGWVLGSSPGQAPLTCPQTNRSTVIPALVTEAQMGACQCLGWLQNAYHREGPWQRQLLKSTEASWLPAHASNSAALLP